MRYQLVLQWPLTNSMKDFDALVDVEDLLEENLANAGAVDGHDAGASEFNIFILTDDPQNSFKQVQTILGNREAWASARVAYREINADKYVVLWPRHLAEFKVS